MRIVSVVGARPNFVKISPLVREMRRHPWITPTLVHTGQHYDEAMSAQFFRDLLLPPPDVNLGVGSGSHAVQTGEVMRRLEPLLVEWRPDLVLVVGDVNSTLATALTAAKLSIPVAHVEAGLRSFDRRMPEEINRLLTDAIAGLLFVTEESARQNLLREGIARDQIHFVGNVMIDALEMCRPLWECSPIDQMLRLGSDRPYAVVTLHRPSNVDDPAMLWTFLRAFQELAGHLPVVFPMHPRVRAMVLRPATAGQRELADSLHGSRRGEGLIVLEPLGYLDFIALMSRAALVLTDSGGVQEETTALRVRCLTLRDTTERPITVTHGTNRVIGSDPASVVSEALQTLEEAVRPHRRPPLWDGHAAIRIVSAIRQWRDRRLRPDNRAAGVSIRVSMGAGQGSLTQIEGRDG